jgi:hypothetical protein
MAGAEFSKVTGRFQAGELHILESNTGRDVLVIGATTGLRALPAGKITPLETATTLTYTYSGRIITCSTDATIFTLPAATTSFGLRYRVVNLGLPGTVEIKVLTGSATDVFVGGGWSSTAVPIQLTNSKATAEPGDMVDITNTYTVAGSSAWFVQGLVGTWISTT